MVNIFSKKSPAGLSTLIIVSGLLISSLIAWKIHVYQDVRAQENFDYIVERNHDFLMDEIKWHDETLYFIGGLMKASDNVQSPEFNQFIEHALQSSDSYDALGWIEYNQQNDTFFWSHVSSPTYAHKIAQQILSDNHFRDLINTAVSQRTLTYFVQTLKDTSFNDAHTDANTNDNIYHLISLLPVYENNTLIGIAYNILDLNMMVQETIAHHTNYNQNYVAYKIRIRRNDVTSAPIYLTGISGVQNNIFIERTMPINEGDLVWTYRPAENFMEQYSSHTALLIFVILSGLTFALAFITALSRNIDDIQMAKDRAEEISRLKSDFLATMSHEIRTPMNGILGMAELIVGSKPDAQINAYAQTIINSGEALQHIIDDILDFSKIEANKLELDITPVDLLELSDDLAALYSTQARDKALELAVRYVPGSEQFIMADPARIRQILGNLLNNAIKFTAKGHISLTIRELKGDTHRSDTAHMQFTITDTGPGLSQSAQSRIFEKFMQGDTTTTRKFGGTGLGLSICKSLVTMMDGTITVESEEGKGASFIVTIPLQRNRDQDNTTTHSAPKIPLLNGVKTLVVDDFPIIRKLVTEQLTLTGMKVNTAANGHEALEALQRAQQEGEPYDLALIDYLMPDMNGEMLASAIHDDPQLRETCLIMLSSAGNPMADHLFRDKGFSAYIAKPVRNLVLIESIALIWQKYKSGIRGQIIKIDTMALGKDKAPTSEVSLENCKILIAEDNLVNQIFIREILESLHAHYTIVSNGLEALDSFAAQPFDLVIMDCLMPEMDGFEATQAIRAYEQANRRAATPILALTANAMKGDREKCLNAGMDDYLSKPVRKDELQQKICALIGKKAKIINPASTDKTEQFLAHTDMAQESGSEPLVSPDMVSSAKETLKDKYGEMLQLYVSTSKSQIDEIKSAYANNNIQAIIRPSHTLKSTSKQMGALKLAECAKDIEYAAKSYCNQNEGAPTALPDINLAAIRSALEHIDELINQTSKALHNMAA